MDFLNTGIPIGHWFGISVRLHFTFLIYAFWRIQGAGDLFQGIAFVVGLYVCILLHEFGHALAARWCDGEADEILLWPLGGLAFCRPAFHPTAHLITTVAGPFVTLVLWLAFWGLSAVLATVAAPLFLSWFVAKMAFLNLVLLLFNLIPAFPMDGGRMLRDVLWHWMNAEKATRIAVRVSQIVALGGIGWALYSQNWWLALLAVFILLQALQERQIVGFEGGGTYQFSLRERIRRGRRQRAFRRGMVERLEAESSEPFHRCATCGRTEVDSPGLDFRVCEDCGGGQEYCSQHLQHPHHR